MRLLGQRIVGAECQGHRGVKQECLQIKNKLKNAKWTECCGASGPDPFSTHRPDGGVSTFHSQTEEAEEKEQIEGNDREQERHEGSQGTKPEESHGPRAWQ